LKKLSNFVSADSDSAAFVKKEKNGEKNEKDFLYFNPDFTTSRLTVTGLGKAYCNLHDVTVKKVL
jgi:hypothetical protein